MARRTNISASINDLDARNFANPTNVTVVGSTGPQSSKSEFIS